jgi:predicted pyridoxine 5'-phosphate oxidase superfamily flavin-nucleotide-binding protein
MARRTNDSTPMLGDDDAPETNGQEPGQESGVRSQESETLSPEPRTLNPEPRTLNPPDGRPYCARHNCLMRAASSPERVTYYQCPVPDCGQSEKRIRGKNPIPAEPQQCTSAICGQQKKPAYLVVDPQRSQLAKLYMVCPRCGFSMQQPRPAFHAGPPRGDEDLSSR